MRALLASAGFVDIDRVEVVLAADVDTLAALPRPPRTDGLTGRRTLGVNGTRFTAYDGERPCGYLEVDTDLGAAERSARFDGWADIGNLETDDEDAVEITTWLLAEAAAWLRLGGVRRLLTYEDDDAVARWEALGFRVLTRTERLAPRRA